VNYSPSLFGVITAARLMLSDINCHSHGSFFAKFIKRDLKEQMLIIETATEDFV
jgi:hypothetical protein